MARNKWEEGRQTMTVFEQMTAGFPYRPDAECQAVHERVSDLVAQYTALYRAHDPQAQQVLSQIVGSLGEGSVIRPSLDFDYGVNTHIGAGCFFNFGCVFLDVAPIRFGDGVLVGPRVQFLTPTHPINPTDRAALWEGGLPITIGSNVWIGGGAIICPGVTIGDNSVIGAGAVVTRDIPANTVAVGNPAKVIKTIDPQARPSDPKHQYSAQALGLES